MANFNRVAVVVVDGVGCGEAEDASSAYPEDKGTNSLRNAATRRTIDAPALEEMGLGEIPGLEGIHLARTVVRERVHGAFGALEPTFAGNGSPEGHQAIMGHVVTNPYQVFNKERIPPDIERLVEDAVTAVTGRAAIVIRYPETDDISGTVFIDHSEIGPRHFTSKDHSEPLYVPIYASSDSLIQIALHQEVIPQSKIEAIGQEVRRLLTERGYRIARVIMRPFTGKPGNFKRVSPDRRDYGVDPDSETVIDQLVRADVPVHGIGKAVAMFNQRGFVQGRSRKLGSDQDRIGAVRDFFSSSEGGLLLANLVDTDEAFGHRRDAKGYIGHINGISRVVEEVMSAMGTRDLLMITSDHGNDPTHMSHTNHTRELVPLLVGGPAIQRPIALGIRLTFADVAETIGEIFELSDRPPVGKSFLQELS